LEAALEVDCGAEVRRDETFTVSYEVVEERD
jgi:hypothetical protein